MIVGNNMKRILIIWLAAVLCGVSEAGAADRHLSAELVADATAVAAGKPFTVGLLLHIDDGWHVYWTNPGDAARADDFEADAAAGIHGWAGAVSRAGNPAAAGGIDGLCL